jgi:hypothetical protein
MAHITSLYMRRELRGSAVPIRSRDREHDDIIVARQSTCKSTDQPDSNALGGF